MGLGQPWWYVGGVKLLFCALSLAVPAAMYWSGRRHFGEAAGRVALLAGAFWYELVGFAHKPMTEFVATAPLLALLALCLRPHADGSRVVWQAAGLAVVAAAIRLQYAPLALLLLGIVLLRTRDRLHLVLAAAVLLFGRRVRRTDLGPRPVPLLPYQPAVQHGRRGVAGGREPAVPVKETGKVSFVRRRFQDPVFAAYRYLARESDAAAVWQVDRAYHGLPGYYYLHRRIPLYDAFTGYGVSHDLATLSASVSHLLVADPAVAVAGYSLEREFGGVRILRRDAGGPPVRQWREYTLTPAGSVTVAMERV